MTIDTTFHQSPQAYAIHALEGLRLLHRDSLISTKRKSRLALRPEQNSANIRHRRHRHQETHAPLSRRVEGKAHDIPKHRQSERTDRVGGALVHTDIKTDVPTPSYRGDKYFIHFTDDKTRHTVPYALRKKSDSANALLAYVAFMRARASKSKNCAPREKVLNEGEMKKALSPTTFIPTTPPYDKKAGGGTSESLILWTHVMAILFAAPHVPRKCGPSSSRPSRSSTTT
ncbi:hypothetical protein RI054_16g76770 [Pseudoscourfieldia marina]